MQYSELETGGIKFLQNVLVKSFNDKFGIGNIRKFNTPMMPGTVLKKPIEDDVLLLQENQILYRTCVGKAMYMMQYLCPDIYQAVWELARHMGAATKTHWDAMFRMMKYTSNTKERGLTLNPTQKWDGRKDHKLIIRG